MSDTNPPLSLQQEFLEEALISGNINDIREYLNNESDVNFITKEDMPLLLEVIKNKDLPNKNMLVDILLSFGADIQKKDKEGLSSLMVSCQLGDYEITETLLLLQAKVNEQDHNDGKTPVMFAIESGNLNLIDLLILHGADLEIKDNNGCNALLYAIRNFDLQQLGDFEADHLDQETLNKIQKEIDNEEISYEGYDSSTLLEITKTLINHEVNINAQDNSLKTASMYAVESNNTEIFKELLNAGSDLNLKNKKGQTAIDIAAQKENLELLELINNANASLNEESQSAVTQSIALMKANREGGDSLNYDQIQKDAIQKAQSNVQPQDYSEMQKVVNMTNEESISSEKINENVYDDLTPNLDFPLGENSSFDLGSLDPNSLNDGPINITTESFKSIDDISQELDKRMLDDTGSFEVDMPSINDNSSSYVEKIDDRMVGKTSYKEELSDVNRVKSLQGGEGHDEKKSNTPQFIVDVNKRNKNGQTPLMAAAVRGDIDQIKDLLQRKANVGMRDTKGITALMFACLQGHVEAAKLLVAQDKSLLNLKNAEGNTALALAVMNNKAPAVSFLISAGAHYNGLYKGMDLMMLAASKGALDVIKILLALSFNPFQRNMKGKSAIEYAQQFKQKEVILFFKDLMNQQKK